MTDKPTKDRPESLPDDLQELLVEIQREIAKEILTTLRNKDKPIRASYIQAASKFLTDNGMSAGIAESLEAVAEDAAEEKRDRELETHLLEKLDKLKKEDEEEEAALVEEAASLSVHNDELATPFD